MPWKESSVLDERIRFVIRPKDGEGMAALSSLGNTPNDLPTEYSAVVRISD